MKFDMVWVWMAAFMAVMLFQNFFTVRKTDWDISYTYTTDAMEYIAYGQKVVTVTSSSDLDWASLRAWLADEIKETKGEKSAIVTILGTNKRDSTRYWRPFWKAVPSV